MSMNEDDRTPNIVVTTDYRLDPPLDDRDPDQVLAAEGGMALQLGDGRRVVLDPADARSAGFVRVVDALGRQDRPIALELDPDGRLLRLFAPHVSPVLALRPVDRGVLAVELAASHGRHTLRAVNPAFDDIRAVLERAISTGATVVLTEDDAHDVLDVQLVGEDRAPPIVVREAPRTLLGRLRELLDSILHWFTCWCWWPWWWWRAMSPSRAQQVFDDLAARSCDPLTVPAPCIPFRYPDDGCWGRAHEMCRLMRDQGLRPCKVWIQGFLHVSTSNNPTCEVYWGWHVAPTHCVRGRGIWGWFQVRSMVFDPALFGTPVTKAQWKGVQGDTNASLTDSSWEIFHLWSTTTNNSWFTRTDPGFVQTDSVLAYYRTALQLRAAQYGPPPYPCP